MLFFFSFLQLGLKKFTPMACVSGEKGGAKVKKEKKSKNQVQPNESGEEGDQK